MFTKAEIMESVLKGILNANNFYESITSGAWLNDSGVESVLQTKIAESIYDMLPKNREGELSESKIVLEYQLASIINESGSDRKRGRVPTLVSGSKRVDILICDRNDFPLVPIEIKRNAATQGFADDAARIIKLLERSDKNAGGSVKYGLICGFIFGKGQTSNLARENIEQKIRVACEYVSEKIPRRQFEFRSLFDDPKEFFDLSDDDKTVWWAGGGIVIYLRNKSI